MWGVGGKRGNSSSIERFVAGKLTCERGKPLNNECPDQRRACYLKPAAFINVLRHLHNSLMHLSP